MKQANPITSQNEKARSQEGPLRLIYKRLGLAAASLQNAEQVVFMGRQEDVGRTAVPNLAGAFISTSVQAPQVSEIAPNDDEAAVNLNTLLAIANGQAVSSGVTTKKIQDYEVSGSSHDF